MEQNLSTKFNIPQLYMMQLNKVESSHLKIEVSNLYTVESAIERLKNIFGNTTDWIEISNLLPSLSKNVLINKSAISSTFVASLELVKNGIIHVRQNKLFGPILLKIR